MSRARATTVGLTGGLASGKSTVARALASAGFTVIDADRIVAELYRPGEPGAQAVAEVFGPGSLASDGSVDKPALARVAFSDPGALARLESAIHPLVRRRFAEIAARTEGIVVLEATKLIEAGFAPDFDLVVTVEAPEEERVRRAVARGLTEAQARERIAAQLGEAERRRAADVVIENDGDLAELEEKCAELVARVRAGLEQRARG